MIILLFGFRAATLLAYDGVSAIFQRIFFLPILYTLIASLGVITSVWRRADIILDAKINPNPAKDFETFDFIVVGAGSAGCLVANRLSHNYNVLLLEAGGEPNPLQSIPAFGVFLYGFPDIDWNHRSVPQTGGTLMSVNQQSSWSAGKGLGGSGSLNLMLYLRGNPRDYNNWAHKLQDSSWSYEEMLPIFKRHENYRDRTADPRYHGFKGELGIELPDFTGIADDFVQAGKDFGYPEIDVNAHHTEGFFKIYHNTQRGVRHSPYFAFIKPIMNRKRLTIRKYALVNKILFREGNRDVYGVEYDRHGTTYTALCTKEIIVSAGAITSPKLLMLSGIGPRKHLEELQIPVRHDLPVGQNLQDHLAVTFGPFLINQPRTLYVPRDVTAESFVNWLVNGKGVLSSSQAQASAVLSSSFAKARGEGDWPDIHFFAFGFSGFPNVIEKLSHSFNFKYDEMYKYYKDDIDKESFQILVSGARPHSKGWIKLGGNSPYDNLIIEPNYLKDPQSIDIKVLVEGMKKAIDLVERSPTFKNLGGRLTNSTLPGCEHFPLRSDGYLECFARRNSATLHHPCCTASMGKKGSKDSVVDSELRVHGVSNLRVIDASVMPTLVVTNTQAGTLGIAEKGAHMILKYWDSQKKVQDFQNLVPTKSKFFGYFFQPPKDVGANYI